jgi:hypothetical protein
MAFGTWSWKAKRVLLSLFRIFSLLLTIYLHVYAFFKPQPMVLERITDTFQPSTGPPLSNNNSSGGGRGAYDSKDFYWFRFILFALLIVSPCFRAGYLWWAGGGRLRLRRDPVTGRVVGIQYTPPMQNWFGVVYHHHPDGQEQVPVHDKLTEEQVMSLPEITFHAHQSNEYDKDNVHVATEGETSKENDETAESVVHINDTPPYTHARINDENDAIRIDFDEPLPDDCVESTDAPSLHGETDAVAIPTLVSKDASIRFMENMDLSRNAGDQPSLPAKNATIDPASGGGLDEEQPLESSMRSDLPSSSLFVNIHCTDCSICIDEFENGERIRLLPRCGHAFHTDCILPWLCERQGCCPLCKMAVLGNDEEEEATTSSPSADEGGVENAIVDGGTSSVNDDGRR